MSTARDPVPFDELKLGPVKVVEVFTSAPPADKPITDSIGHAAVPFDQIKDLISDKPLERANWIEPSG